MIAEGNTNTGATFHGRHVPLPTQPRPIRERPTTRGYNWPTITEPDQDALARLVRAGILTATPDTIEGKPVRIIRKAPPARATTNRNRALVPNATTGRKRKQLDDEAIAQAYRDGASLHNIARQHQAARVTIRARLEAAGVYVRPSGGSGPKVDTGHVLATLAQGYTQAETARRLGVSERTIRNHRRKASATPGE